MKDKLIGVCESAYGFSPTIVTENTRAMDGFEKMSLEEKALISYDRPEKVMVGSDKIDYFIEYSNNLERYIKDSGLEFHEAVEEICKANDCLIESVVIVVDESCVDKLDLIALGEKYKVKRV